MLTTKGRIILYTCDLHWLKSVVYDDASNTSFACDNNRLFYRVIKIPNLFARVSVLQKAYWTSDSESNAISVGRRRVQIKSSILPNTVE